MSIIISYQQDISNDEFELIEVPDVRFKTIRNPGNKASGISFRQGGRDHQATRIDQTYRVSRGPTIATAT